MNFLVSLAAKNLSRYKRRTLITSLAIAIGIAIYIWIDAFMIGIEKDSERNTIWYETGSAQVINTEYFEERTYLPLNFLVEKSDEIVNDLKAAGYPAIKRVSFGGELFFSGGSRQLKFLGIEPEAAKDIFRYHEIVDDGGNYLEAGKHEILIGYRLAEDLKIKVGDEIEIRTNTRYRSRQTFSLTVAGILDSPNPVLNKALGIIPLDIVDASLQMETGVTDIPFYVTEYLNLDKELEKVSALLKDKYPDLEVRDWNDIMGNLTLMETKRQSLGFFLFLVFVIAAVGISNTMLMAVFERMREIGMMRAMGMDDKHIRISFLFEAAGIGLIGSFAGLVLGGLLTFYTVNWGIDYSGLIGDMDIGYRVFGVFRAAWNPVTMVTAFILGVVSSVIVSFIPSSKALKMGITDCLRHQ